MKKQLPEWKPIVSFSNKDNPILFSELGEAYDDEEEDVYTGLKGLITKQHIIIIFFENESMSYYYLRVRNVERLSKDANGRITRKTRNTYQGEVWIKETTDGGLYDYDSLVDCSNIYKCKKELLESLIDTNSQYFKDTDELIEFDINNILTRLKENIMQKPPYLSIIETKLDKNNKTYGDSLFLSQTKIYELDAICGLLRVDMSPYAQERCRVLNSSNIKLVPSSITRYNTGMNFCKVFLNKYFPEDLKSFDKIQNEK